MAGNIKNKLELKVCKECGGIYKNYRSPDECPMCERTRNLKKLLRFAKYNN